MKLKARHWKWIIRKQPWSRRCCQLSSVVTHRILTESSQPHLPITHLFKSCNEDMAFLTKIMSKQSSPLWDKAGMPLHVDSSQWLFRGENREQKNPHMLLCWQNMSKTPNTPKFPKNFHAGLMYTFSMHRYIHTQTHVCMLVYSLYMYRRLHVNI